MSQSQTILKAFQGANALQRLVDEAFALTLQTDSPMNRLAPITEYTRQDLFLYRISRNVPSVAVLLGVEQEIPRATTSARLSEDSIKNLILGKKYVLTQADYMQIARLEDASINRTDKQFIRDQIYGSAADFAPAIAEKALALLMLVMAQGSVTYADPLSGHRAVLTYPGTIPALLPAALSGGSAWSASTTATGMQNLIDHYELIKSTTGITPDWLMMRSPTLNLLKAQTSTKRMLTQSTEATADFSGIILSLEQMREAIRSYLPGTELLIVDEVYYEDTVSGLDPVSGTWNGATMGRVQKNYLLDNYYVFGFNGNYERAFVPTVEKNLQPGIFVGTREESVAPRRDSMFAMAYVVPWVSDPRLIAARKVIP